MDFLNLLGIGAIVYFIYIILFVVPLIELHKLVPASIPIDISHAPGFLLPREKACEKDNHLSTVAKIRSTSFSVDLARQDYLYSPVIYALALARVDLELRTVLHRVDNERYKRWKKQQSFLRHRRDCALDAPPGHIRKVTLFNSFWWTMRLETVQLERCIYCNKIHTEDLANQTCPESQQINPDGTINWMIELETFQANIHKLCYNIGVEVVKYSPAKECIERLRQHNLTRRHEFEPFVAHIVRLNQELATWKKINAALQIRRIIEKLTFEIWNLPPYSKLPGSGPKWKLLWEHMWKDLQLDPDDHTAPPGNIDSPLYKMAKNEKGQYSLKDLNRRGMQLFEDMSAEIHGYEKREFDYEHFPPGTNAIAKCLKPLDENNDPETGEVDWAKEIKRYLVKGGEK